MRSPAASAEVLSWTPERFGYRIECSPALLAAIGEQHTAGLLYGHATGSALRIAAYRAAPAGALERLLEIPASQGGMALLGWYRSGPFDLTRREAAFHSRCFPECWQVAMMLRPDPPGQVRVAFFFREPEGDLRPGPPYQEFAVPLPGPLRTTRRPAREGPRWWLWAAAAAALLLPFLAVFEPPSPNAPAPAGFALRLEDRGGMIRIEWDRRAPAVLQASNAHLEVIDGPAVTRIALDSSQLRTGSVAYLRSHESASVRMVLESPGAAPVEETAHLTGPPQVSRVEPWLRRPEEAPPLAEVRAEPPPPAVPPRAEVRETPPPVEAPTRAPEPPPDAPQPRPFRLPARPSSASRAQRAALDLPTVTVQPRARPAPLPTATPRAPEPPPPAAPPGPAAGRIIWSGRLERRAVLHIEGRQASTGALSAPLPGRPAAVTAIPGELTSEGLRLYTADLRLAGRAEPPGPQNGWNATVYVWDPTRAAAVQVLEPPGEANGWNRMVLRSETRAHSVIVLRWMAPPQAAASSAAP